ncbi:cysteine desulfurase, mitochondrial-like, partial [Eurosta solidaginis]|uniref:cysteine desulfurase, mitochondrial-like n=1 Tax=Eurosta solidaginis TaxID=178769 RepID=UPI003530E2D8
ACVLALKEMEYDKKFIDFLSKRLYDRITSRLSHGICNTDPEQRYSGLLNLSLLMALKDVALSSASACTYASLEPLYVLRAIGTDEDLAHSSIRFGIGRFTTIEEVDCITDTCIKHVDRLREMSPLWEMVLEAIDLKNIKWSQY